MADMKELENEARSFHKAYCIDLARANRVINTSIAQSSDFVVATKDINPIHRKMDGLDEVVSPGFLQNCAAIVLSRQAMNAADFNTLDYPHSFNECEMRAPVVTGLDYAMAAVFDGTRKRADVEIRNQKGDIVYTLTRGLFKESANPARLGLNGELVYDGEFRIDGEDSIHNFGRLIGSESSESNLRAFAGASSAVCSAIAAGKLNTLDEGVEAMYAGRQQFYLDSSRTLNLQKGIGMKLYVSGREKFGKKSEKEDYVGISIVGEDAGRTIYQFNANLAFVDRRIVPLMIKRALKCRN